MEPRPKSIKVIIIRPTRVKAFTEQEVKPRKIGEVIEVGFEDGRYLVASLKAVDYNDKNLKEVKELAAQEDKKRAEAEKDKIESAKFRAAMIANAAK